METVPDDSDTSGKMSISFHSVSSSSDIDYDIIQVEPKLNAQPLRKQTKPEPLSKNERVIRPYTGYAKNPKTKPLKRSPPVQTMERPIPGFDPNRIPNSVFMTQTEPTEWSMASTESLFSIRIGNTSFSKNHVVPVPKQMVQKGESEISEKAMDSSPTPIEASEGESVEEFLEAASVISQTDLPELSFKHHVNTNVANKKQEIKKKKQSPECCCSGCTCEFCCSVKLSCCFCKWPGCDCCEKLNCENTCRWPSCKFPSCKPPSCRCCRWPSCNNCCCTFKCPSCSNCCKWPSCDTCDNCCSFKCCKWPSCGNNCCSFKCCKPPSCDNCCSFKCFESPSCGSCCSFKCCDWPSCNNCCSSKCCKWPSCDTCCSFKCCSGCGDCSKCCNWPSYECCKGPTCGGCSGCCKWPKCGGCSDCCTWPSCCSCKSCCQWPSCKWRSCLDCFSSCSCTSCCKSFSCTLPAGCCQWPSCSCRSFSWSNIFCCFPKPQRLSSRRPSRGIRR